jgi:hypothetical protein
VRREPPDVGWRAPAHPCRADKELRLRTPEGASYNSDQAGRLNLIHERLIEARRELDALIGDAYLRPRASIVPVHFLDLASAVEKLRWAEKEWRELNVELREAAHKRQAEDPVVTTVSGEEARNANLVSVLPGEVGRL